MRKKVDRTIISCAEYFLCVSRGLQKEEPVLLTHGDSVDKVAEGFKIVAQSGNIVAGGWADLK